MRTLIIYAAILYALAHAAYIVADRAEQRVRQAQALQCARLSDGADDSIADCYTVRDLPIPSDL